MQVGEQVLNLLVGHHLAESLHFAAAVLDDLTDALVIGGQSAQRQVLLLENTFERRTFLAARGVRLMAAIAVFVVKFPAGGLLRIEPEFRIRLAPFDLASQRREQN